MNKFRSEEKIQNGYLSQSWKYLPYQKNHGRIVAQGTVSKTSGKEVTVFSLRHFFQGLKRVIKKGGVGGQKYKHLSQNCKKCLICTKGNSG